MKISYRNIAIAITVALLVMVFVNGCLIGALTKAPFHPYRWPNGIVVHHTDLLCSSLTLRDSHINFRGWKDGGYHYLIRRDGTVEALRPVSEIGSHAGSDNRRRNFTDIGIALEDDKTHPVNKAQLNSLVRLIADNCRQYGIVPSVKTITRHHQQCPGSKVPLDEVISRAKTIIDENRSLLYKDFIADGS